MENDTPIPDLIVFKGKDSQTGIAFKREFKDIDFEDTDFNFINIKELIQNYTLKAILPIWNSHAGEVKISHAMSMLFEEQARLYYLWPEQIIFECLTRYNEVEPKKLISVQVAEQQCKNFILENNYRFSLPPAPSSLDAYNLFHKDSSFGAVLCAPGSNRDGYEVLSEDATNPINFTSFALLGSINSAEWSPEEWGAFSNNILPSSRVFVALQMPISDPPTESQEALFHSLIEDASSTEDIPKVLFVAKHDFSKCRLLIESAYEIMPEIINENGGDEDIKIIPNVGVAKKEYAEKAYRLIDTLIDTTGLEFIEHIGVDSCFYACPALGIITHGFEKEVTKHVVLQIIKKHFDLLSNLGYSDNPSNSENLFRKYEKQYQREGVSFIQFNSIGIN